MIGMDMGRILTIFNSMKNVNMSGTPASKVEETEEEEVETQPCTECVNCSGVGQIDLGWGETVPCRECKASGKIFEYSDGVDSGNIGNSGAEDEGPQGKYGAGQMWQRDEMDIPPEHSFKDLIAGEKFSDQAVNDHDLTVDDQIEQEGLEESTCSFCNGNRYVEAHDKTEKLPNGGWRVSTKAVPCQYCNKNGKRVTESEGEPRKWFVSVYDDNTGVWCETPGEVYSVMAKAEDEDKIAAVYDEHREEYLGGLQGDDDGFYATFTPESGLSVDGYLKVYNIMRGWLKESEEMDKKLTETAPPDQEAWVKKNKSRFKKEYGPKKGEEVLYATAWKNHNKKKTNECDGCGTSASGQDRDAVSINSVYNSDSDEKSVTVTARNASADELMRLLKLSGIMPNEESKSEIAPVPEPAAVTGLSAVVVGESTEYPAMDTLEWPEIKERQDYLSADGMGDWECPNCGFFGYANSENAESCAACGYDRMMNESFSEFQPELYDAEAERNSMYCDACGGYHSGNCHEEPTCSNCGEPRPVGINRRADAIELCPDCFKYGREDEDFQDREPDDFETYNQNEADDYMHESKMNEAAGYYITGHYPKRRDHYVRIFIKKNFDRKNSADPDFLKVYSKNDATVFDDLDEAKKAAADCKQKFYMHGLQVVPVLPGPELVKRVGETKMNESLTPKRENTGMNSAPRTWQNEPNEQMAGWKALVQDSEGLSQPHDMFNPVKGSDNIMTVATKKRETEKPSGDFAANAVVVSAIAERLQKKFSALTEAFCKGCKGMTSSIDEFGKCPNCESQAEDKMKKPVKESKEHGEDCPNCSGKLSAESCAGEMDNYKGESKKKVSEVSAQGKHTIAWYRKEIERELSSNRPNKPRIEQLKKFIKGHISEKIDVDKDRKHKCVKCGADTTAAVRSGNYSMYCSKCDPPKKSVKEAKKYEMGDDPKKDWVETPCDEFGCDYENGVCKDCGEKKKSVKEGTLKEDYCISCDKRIPSGSDIDQCKKCYAKDHPAEGKSKKKVSESKLGDVVWNGEPKNLLNRIENMLARKVFGLNDLGRPAFDAKNTIKYLKQWGLSDEQVEDVRKCTITAMKSALKQFNVPADRIYKNPKDAFAIYEFLLRIGFGDDENTDKELKLEIGKAAKHKFELLLQRYGHEITESTMKPAEITEEVSKSQAKKLQAALDALEQKVKKLGAPPSAKTKITQSMERFTDKIAAIKDALAKAKGGDEDESEAEGKSEEKPAKKSEGDKPKSEAKPFEKKEESDKKEPEEEGKEAEPKPKEQKETKSDEPDTNGDDKAPKGKVKDIGKGIYESEVERMQGFRSMLVEGFEGE